MSRLTILIAVYIFLLISLNSVCSQSTRAYVPSTVQSYPSLQTKDNYAATLIMRGLSGARSIFFDREGDLLVVVRTLNAIYAVYENPPQSGKYSSTRILNAPDLGLNHGLAIRDNYLYASSQDAVYRWPYTPKQRRLITTAPQTVISGITPGAGTTLGANQGHLTRTIVFSPDNQYVFVSIGSKENLDPDSSRARVRRFSFPPISDESQRQLPIQFETGEVWADGLRNAVALGFDFRGRLWEVDNGPDNLERADLGGDIHSDNPAEEVNLLDGPVGKKYGYPYCFTAGNTTQSFLNDPIRGTQFAWPGYPATDDWCRSLANNQPPLATVPAHSSPLQVVFYPDATTGKSANLGCDSGPGAFPCALANDAFIALHGSWNSNIPKGYRVSRLAFNKNSPYNPNNGSSGLEDIVWQKNSATLCDTQQKASSCFRPSGLAFDNAGTMWVASGVTGELFRVVYLNGVTVSGSQKTDDPSVNFSMARRSNSIDIFMVSLTVYFVLLWI